MTKISLKSNYDDLSLSVILCEPKNKGVRTIGIIQIVHGMCEHKERYLDFMNYMASEGFVCICHDHRGHGESVKQISDLGYMYNGGWEGLVDDIKTVNEWIKEKYPNTKCIMLGHSMGSLAVRSFLKRYDNMIDALFISGSPSNNPASGIGKMLVRIISKFKGEHYRSSFLRSITFAGYNKGIKNDGYKNNWVCSDKTTLQLYHSDPLCMFTFTNNGFYNLFSLMQDCYSKSGWLLSNPELPILFLSGMNDPCKTSNKKFLNAVNHLKKLGYKNTDYILFYNMRHEILNETNRIAVYDYILRKAEKFIHYSQ